MLSFKMMDPTYTTSSRDESNVVPFPKPSIEHESDGRLTHVATDPEVCILK